MLLTPTSTPKRPSHINMSSPLHSRVNTPLPSPSLQHMRASSLSHLRPGPPSHSPLLRSISAGASRSSSKAPFTKETVDAASVASTLFAVAAPALRICLNFAYAIQYGLTLILSFLLSNGFLATKHFLTHSKYTLIFLGLRGYYLSQLIATAAYYITKEAAVRSWRTSIAVTKEAYRRSEPARQRLFFEFMLLLFHPAPMIMLIFWPGWILVGAGYVWWTYC